MYSLGREADVGDFGLGIPIENTNARARGPSSQCRSDQVAVGIGDQAAERHGTIGAAHRPTPKPRLHPSSSFYTVDPKYSSGPSEVIRWMSDEVISPTADVAVCWTT
jgi:hypothetical protein